MGSVNYRLVAGLAFIGAGGVILLEFTTAAALFPGYSIAADTISALGATDGTAESNVVFNGTMVVAGLVGLLGAWALHQVYDRWLLTGVLAMTSVIGYIGVGLFPAQTGVPHSIAVLVSFGGTGVVALLVGTVTRGSFRYVSIALGVVELVALGLFVVFRADNPLGIGGLEWWVAYLGVVWAIAFGGYLLGSASQ